MLLLGENCRLVRSSQYLDIAGMKQVFELDTLDRKCADVFAGRSCERTSCAR